MAKPMAGTGGGEAPTSSTRPQVDPLVERFFDLNQVFGEVVDGRVLGRDDFVTDPDQLSQFPRPSEEEVREQVRGGFAGLRGGNKKR